MSLSLQAIYVYQKAAILSMMSEDEVKKTGEDIVDLFRSVWFNNKNMNFVTT